MERFNVDTVKMESDLKELAGKVPFRLHVKPRLGMKVSVKETDKGIDIRINPKHIRTQAQLDDVMHHCQTSFNIGGQL